MKTRTNQSSLQMANKNDGKHIIEIEERPSNPTDHQTSPPSSAGIEDVFNSGIWISTQTIITVIQIVASIWVLWLSNLHANPDLGIYVWVMGYAAGCFLRLPVFYCRYMFARTFSSQHYGVVVVLNMTSSSFFVVWFILGNVQAFEVAASSSDATNLEKFLLMFLAGCCMMYGIPFLLCATTWLLILAFGEEERRGVAADFSNVLPAYRFKLRENGRSGGGGVVLAAGTGEERALSGEDAVCCICFGKYGDDDEVRELPCGHFCHVGCVDKWLKINARCPPCQSSWRNALF